MARQLDRSKIKAALKKEEERFLASHPKSKVLFEKAKKSLLGGVPMNWMVKWPGHYPIFIDEGKGVHFTDVDGNKYLDLCLGDTGAMTGHAPDPSVKAIVDRVQKGTTFMLPIEDALEVGEELQRRFGLPYWQFALTATDANRFVIRLCRHITQRPKILVFNWCYHGSVDETFITLLPDGSTKARVGNTGPPVDPNVTTRVAEWNDLPSVEKALAHGDVACILTEPALTNIGIVPPAPGFLEGLRELSTKYGTFLIHDETHTICCGPGGYTRAHNLHPDILTLGKPIAGGVPAAIYGFSEEVAQRIQKRSELDTADTGGIGGTLAGNALSIAAMKATLKEVLTEEAFSRMIPLAERFAQGVRDVIAEYNLPWNVQQLGCRAEYWFRLEPAKNGHEAATSMDHDLDAYMHLANLNRGILMTPFHNMALMAPQTTAADIDLHTKVFRECVAQLFE